MFEQKHKAKRKLNLHLPNARARECRRGALSSLEPVECLQRLDAHGKNQRTMIQRINQRIPFRRRNSKGSVTLSQRGLAPWRKDTTWMRDGSSFDVVSHASQLRDGISSYIRGDPSRSENIISHTTSPLTLPCAVVDSPCRFPFTFKQKIEYRIILSGEGV